MILADTSGILVLLDPRHERHEAAKRYLPDLLIPTSILCEVDYLASERFGPLAARRFLASLAEAKFPFLNLDLLDIQLTYTLMEQYADANIGFVDASIVALAERHKINRVLTLDRKHFSFVKAPTLGILASLP